MNKKLGSTFVLIIGMLLMGCSSPTDTPEMTTETATEVAQPIVTSTSTLAAEATVPVSQGEATSTATIEPTPTATVEPTPESVTNFVWEADGVISEGEYTQQADFGGIRLWWRNDETYVYLVMEGDTSGWVSVGIAPEQGMQGANYIFGYVENGEAKIWDAYGTAPTGPNHPPDEELGGTNDIVTYRGLEENGITRFEVQIPLDSGDDFDKALEPGLSYPIIVAMGNEDDFDAFHIKYARGELQLVADR